MDRRTFLTAAAATILGVGTRDGLLAQSSSSQPVRLIVPFAPGGAPDPYARLIADHMARSLARIIIVEHKPGASGNTGTHFVMQEPADGNLMLLATQSLIEINPSTFGNLKWKIEDLIPLVRGVEAPLVLVANPGVPARTVTELVAWIKNSPGKLSYSSYTAGSPSHFLGFQLNERFGLDLVHVPSKGSGFQATELMAGHVQFGFAQLQSTLPLISEGKLNALALTSSVRSRFLPDVPSFAELGYPEFTTNVWFGLMLRAGTAPDVVARFMGAAKAAHADPDVRARLEAQGFAVSGQSGPEFAADIAVQTERWARLVKAAGFKGAGN